MDHWLDLIADGLSGMPLGGIGCAALMGVSKSNPGTIIPQFIIQIDVVWRDWLCVKCSAKIQIWLRFYIAKATEYGWLLWVSEEVPTLHAPLHSHKRLVVPIRCYHVEGLVVMH